MKLRKSSKLQRIIVWSLSILVLVGVIILGFQQFENRQLTAELNRLSEKTEASILDHKRRVELLNVLELGLKADFNYEECDVFIQSFGVPIDSIGVKYSVWNCCCEWTNFRKVKPGDKLGTFVFSDSNGTKMWNVSLSKDTIFVVDLQWFHHGDTIEISHPGVLDEIPLGKWKFMPMRGITWHGKTDEIEMEMSAEPGILM